jgi:hypothetical protein
MSGLSSHSIYEAGQQSEIGFFFQDALFRWVGAFSYGL